MMVKTDDWRNAYLDVVERGRDRLGDPPTPEELEAWSRGELSDSEAEERIRQLLAVYPDLAAALNEDDEVADDEAPVLTRADLAADWELLQERMSERVSRDVAAAQVVSQPSLRWRWSTIVPVLAAVLFGTLFLQSRWTVRALRAQLDQPRGNVERLVLLESASRGPETAIPITLQPSTQYVVLALTATENVPAGALHVDIRDLDVPSRPVIWQGRAIRTSDGTFPIEIPRSFLRSRSYAVNLSREGKAQPLAVYTFWVSR